mmetsp:Transcript_9665/g.26691  ORF Transcript_9665/g.26691 Transcript_9665/m.26691 type:complete len:202 (+) Transcript_9665:1790-2395(+)
MRPPWSRYFLEFLLLMVGEIYRVVVLPKRTPQVLCGPQSSSMKQELLRVRKGPCTLALSHTPRLGSPARLPSSAATRLPPPRAISIGPPRTPFPLSSLPPSTFSPSAPLSAIARSPLVPLPSAPVPALVPQCPVMIESAPTPSDSSPRAPSVPLRPLSMPHVGQISHVMRPTSPSHQVIPQPQHHPAHHRNALWKDLLRNI